MSKTLLCTLALFLVPYMASAAIQPVPAGSEAGKVADSAATIFNVYNLSIGETAYKIVTMDSGLNADTTSTTMVLVGQGGVGGDAGYENAFQLTPSEELRGIKSARVVGKEIRITTFSDKSKVIYISYDPKLKQLNVR